METTCNAVHSIWISLPQLLPHFGKAIAPYFMSETHQSMSVVCQAPIGAVKALETISFSLTIDGRQWAPRHSKSVPAAAGRNLRDPPLLSVPPVMQGDHRAPLRPYERQPD